VSATCRPGLADSWRNLSRGSGIHPVALSGALASIRGVLEPSAKRAPSLGQRLAELLALRREDLVVGLGAGAFSLCLALLEQTPLRYQMVVADGSSERLDALVSTPSVRPVRMSPVEFARFPSQWDKIVLHDAVVSRDGAELDGLLRLLSLRLRPAGRIAAVLCEPPRPRPAALQRSIAVASRVRVSGFEVGLDAVVRPEGCWGLVVGAKRKA
jgi:hypothetical protein